MSARKTFILGMVLGFLAVWMWIRLDSPTDGANGPDPQKLPVGIESEDSEPMNTPSGPTVGFGFGAYETKIPWPSEEQPVQETMLEASFAWILQK